MSDKDKSKNEQIQDVTRYDFNYCGCCDGLGSTGMWANPDGDFVTYTDYMRLKEEISKDELIQELTRSIILILNIVRKQEVIINQFDIMIDDLRAEQIGNLLQKAGYEER